MVLMHAHAYIYSWGQQHDLCETDTCKHWVQAEEKATAEAADPRI